MIFIVGAVSVISLALNILIYRKIADAVKPVYFDISIQPLPVEEEPEAETEAHDLQPVTVPMVQEVYQGWRNQNSIPWVEPVKPPAPIIRQPANQGPLARPDGFV